MFVFCKDFQIARQKRRRTPETKVEHTPKRQYTRQPEPVRLVNYRAEVPKYRNENTLKTTYEWSDIKREHEVIAVRREQGIILDKSMSNQLVLPLDLEPFRHYTFAQWFIYLLTIQKHEWNNTFVVLDKYFHDHSPFRQAIEYLSTRKPQTVRTYRSNIRNFRTFWLKIIL